jgi:hypothetical protein
MCFSLYSGASRQAAFQFGYMIITIAIGGITGLLTGWIVDRPSFDPLPNDALFKDSLYWEVPSEEVPYYNDTRSDVHHHANDSSSASMSVEDEAGQKVSERSAVERLSLLEASLEMSVTKLAAAQRHATNAWIAKTRAFTRIAAIKRPKQVIKRSSSNRVPYPSLHQSGDAPSSSLSSSHVLPLMNAQRNNDRSTSSDTSSWPRTAAATTRGGGGDVDTMMEEVLARLVNYDWQQ